MSAEVLSDLNLTLEGLETGLRVWHITSHPLVSVTPDRSVAELSQDQDLEGLDVLPVVNEHGHVIAVWHRTIGHNGHAVRDVMQPLVSSMLVSSRMSLEQFLPLLRDTHYRLVIDEERIAGIVTRSDVLRMPVRVYAYSIVAHLEVRMSELIHDRFPNDTWHAKLQPSRIKKIRERFGPFQEQRLDPSFLDFAMLCDKRDILRNEGLMSSARKWDEALKAIEELRNSLVHDGQFIHARDGVRAFLDVIEQCRSIIRVIEDSLQKGHRYAEETHRSLATTGRDQQSECT